MRRPRFSIASMLLAIGILGVALAAHRSPSHLWANAVYTIAFGMLMVAIVNAVYGWREQRAFWMGFLLCGGAYFAVYSVPGLRDSVCPRLVTVAILDLLYPHNNMPAQRQWIDVFAGYVGNSGVIVNNASGMIMDSSPVALTPIWTTGATVMTPTPASTWLAWTEPDHTFGVGYQIGSVSLASSDSYRQIGHSIFTLLVGIFGGSFAPADSGCGLRGKRLWNLAVTSLLEGCPLVRKTRRRRWSRKSRPRRRRTTFEGSHAVAKRRIGELNPAFAQVTDFIS